MLVFTLFAPPLPLALGLHSVGAVPLLLPPGVLPGLRRGVFVHTQRRGDTGEQAAEERAA
jgi:hypothetical protein